VLRIRSVESHVDVRRGGPHHTGEVCPAHYAVRSAVPFQQREHLIPVPAWVTEPDRDLEP
jgi:hypothetical protein